MENVYKILLMGAKNVGKTSILSQFLKKTFSEEYFETEEDTISTKSHVIVGQKIDLEIIDPKSDEKIRAANIKKCDGFLCVFSITEDDSFRRFGQIHEKILKIKEVKDDETLPFIIVGNKSDLTDQRTVPIEEAQALADDWKVPYIETSAKEDQNVQVAFGSVLRQIRAKKLAIKEKVGFHGLKKPDARDIIDRKKHTKDTKDTKDRDSENTEELVMDTSGDLPPEKSLQGEVSVREIKELKRLQERNKKLTNVQKRKLENWAKENEEDDYNIHDKRPKKKKHTKDQNVEKNRSGAAKRQKKNDIKEAETKEESKVQIIQQFFVLGNVNDMQKVANVRSLLSAPEEKSKKSKKNPKSKK